MIFRQILVSLLLVSGASSCLGQTVVLTETGAYLLTKDADNTPSYSLVGTELIDLRGDAPVPPKEPPKIDLELANKVKSCATETNDPDGAQVIAKVYAHVRGALEDDILNTTTVWDALKQATDKALETTNSMEVWRTCRQLISDDLAERQQRGRMVTKGEIVLFLRSIQSGLEASVDGSFAISIDLEVKVAAITNEAIDDCK